MDDQKFGEMDIEEYGILLIATTIVAAIYFCLNYLDKEAGALFFLGIICFASLIKEIVDG